MDEEWDWETAVLLTSLTPYVFTEFLCFLQPEIRFFHRA